MSRALSLSVLAVAAASTLVPFVCMIAVSMSGQGAIYAGSLLPAPSVAAIAENYGNALTTVPLPRYMANGVFVCAVIVAQIIPRVGGPGMTSRAAEAAANVSQRVTSMGMVLWWR